MMSLFVRNFLIISIIFPSPVLCIINPLLLQSDDCNNRLISAAIDILKQVPETEYSNVLFLGIGEGSYEFDNVLLKLYLHQVHRPVYVCYVIGSTSNLPINIKYVVFLFHEDLSAVSENH